MGDLPWFQFYPNDWLSGTRGLSAVETGVYITIIATLYDRASPLPNDPERLSRLCGASKRVFTAALARLVDDGKLVVTDEGIWNTRVEEELKNRTEKVEKKKKAAEARWGDNSVENQQQDNAPALQEQCETDAMSEVRSQKSEVRESARIDGAPEAKELQFWDEVQSYLSKPDDLTDWETDFLHSIKKADSLTKPQLEKLKSIRAKMQAADKHPAEPIQVKIIREGTPEWEELKKSRPRLVARDIQTPNGIVRGEYGRAA